MKKISKIIVLVITFMFLSCNIKALNYSNAVSKAENYLNSIYEYKTTYHRYLIPIPEDKVTKFYTELEQNGENFKYGGLLSEYEFLITEKHRGNKYSYLYESDDFWTLSNGNRENTKKVISNNVNNVDIHEESPGVKVTEFVDDSTMIMGAGAYDDPWVFIPKYQVTIKTNDKNKGMLIDPTVSPQTETEEVTITLSRNSTAFLNVKAKEGYQYLGNTCGYIINDIDIRNSNNVTQGQLKIYEVSRDFECKINFGEKPFEVLIETDGNSSNNTNLNKIYILPKKSWYSDEQAQHQISKINNVPKKTGFKTEGLYLENNGELLPNNTCQGIKYISSDGTLKDVNEITRAMIANNVTLYPCYIPNQYTVKYDCNGGTGELQPTTHYYNVAADLRENACTREGYKFLGWNTEPNGSGASYSTGSQTTPVASEGTVTLYAEWEKLIKYTAKIHLNGASSVSKEEIYCYTDDATKGCDITLPTITPASGFTVLGFNTIQNATSSTKDPSTTVNLKSDTNFYAITKSTSPYTITFNTNGSSDITSSIDCYRYNGNSTCKVVAPNATPKDGYTLIGLNTDANATTSSWNIGTEKEFTSSATYNVIQSKEIQATFEKNGASTITATTVKCKIYNAQQDCTIKTPGITPITGFSTVGWNTSSSATESEVGQNANVSIKSNKKYYAITKKEIKATFIANGASSIGSSIKTCEVYNGSTSGCKITAPTITASSGFSVVGWNISSSATTSTLDPGVEITIKNDVTYYAITNKTIKVTFNTNGASSIGSSSETCKVYNGSTSGCKIKAPTITASSGFSVVGWNTASNETTSTLNVNAETTVTENKTYYAITKKGITATFVANGASSIGYNNKTCYAYNGSTNGCKVTSPSITPVSGFTAVGWNTDEDATTSILNVNTDVTIKNNVTYNAITTKTITVTFNKNGASDIAYTSKQCVLKKGDTSTGCVVRTPAITPASGFTTVGWGTSASAIKGTSPNSDVTVTADKNYYAVTRKTLTATFVSNGASSISSTSASCLIYNGSTSGCSVSTPTITPKTGFTVLGWANVSSSQAASTQTASVNQNATTTIKADTTFYAITQSSTEITVTFKQNGTGTSDTTRKCRIYNSQTSCSVTSPAITASSGYTALGWNTSSTATASSWTQNTAKSFSANATYYAIQSKQVTVTFKANGSSTTETTRTCNITGSNTTCSVTTPAITPASGFTAVGWNTSSSATASAVNQNSSLSVSANATYYAITKSTAAISVTFKQNGSSTADSTKTCYRYNGAGSCNITSPAITPASGFAAVGWNTSSSATSSGLNTSTAKAFSANATYYAITKSTSAISVTFNIGSTSTTTSTKTCYRYNGASSCTIQTPAITPKSGYTQNGWGTSSSSSTASYNASTNYSFSAGTTLYALQKKTITITFNKNTASSVSPTSRTCTMYNSSTTCSVQMATITAGSGKTAVGWGTSSSSTSSSYTPGSSYSFSASTTLYAITKANTQTYTFNFKKSSSHSFYSYSSTTKSCSGAGSCTVSAPSFSTGRNNKYGNPSLKPCWAIGDGYGCYYWPGEYMSSSESTTWYTAVDFDNYYYSISDNGVNARSCASTSCGIVDGLNNGHTFRPTSYKYASGSGCDNSIWYYGYSEEEGWWGYICSYYVN